MRRLVLVRHGETEESRRKIVQGWLPGTLSVEGTRQAALLAERFRDAPIDTICSSDLERAVATARAIAAFHPGARLLPLRALRERNFGGLQGRTAADLIADPPDATRANDAIAGVEPVAEFRRRVCAFFEDLDDLLGEHDRGTILIVSHGGPLRLLHHLLFERTPGPPQKAGFMHPAAVSEFEQLADGAWRVLRLDCRAHLDPGTWSEADRDRILALLEERAASSDGEFRKAAVEEIDAAVRALEEEGVALPGPLPRGHRMTIVEHASFFDGVESRQDLSVDDTLLADLDRIERLLRD